MIEWELADITPGRFGRALRGLTAVAAVATLIATAEVYLKHDRASFGNKWMRSPVLVTPRSVPNQRTRIPPMPESTTVTDDKAGLREQPDAVAAMRGHVLVARAARLRPRAVPAGAR